MFDQEDLDFSEKLEDFSNEDILNIATNHVSEAILRSSLANSSNFGNQILSYEAKIINNDLVLSLTPKQETAYRKIIRESKGSQTGNDVKISVNDYNNQKEISGILNAILKLKNLKHPLENLPESAITIKKMKREVNEKIVTK